MGQILVHITNLRQISDRLLLKAGALPSVPASGEAALPLLLSARQGSRSLYLTLFDTEHPNSFRRIWVQLDPRAARARFRHDGVTGHIGFVQTSPVHPVQTDVALFGLNNSAGTSTSTSCRCRAAWSRGTHPAARPASTTTPSGWTPTPARRPARAAPISTRSATSAPTSSRRGSRAC